MVLSTYHQCIKYPWQDTHGTIIANDNPFQIVDVYFTDAIYHQKINPQEEICDTSGKDNDSYVKPQKLKIRHDIKVTKDKPMLLPNSVA